MMSPSKVEKVHRFLSRDGLVRASAVTASDLVLEMQKINAMSPLAIMAVGRATVGCVLLASHQKEDRVSMLFDGNGPLGKFFVESSFDGKTRAYVSNPHVDLPLVDGKLDVSGAVGIGLLNVTHISNMQKAPYRGTVIIKTGEIGSDIAFYLEQSHQIPSVVSLAVSLDSNGMVKHAGGVLIELMPGHTEETIRILEKNVGSARNLSEMLEEGLEPKDFLQEYMGSIRLDQIEHNHSLSYSCTCSEDRVKNSLILLGKEEVKDIMTDEEPIEIRCDFCGKKYYLSRVELEEVVKEIEKKAMH